MNHTQTLFHRCTRLLFGLLIAAAGFAVSSQTAEAQRLDCDQLGVGIVETSTKGDSCCLRFVLENDVGSYIDGITIHSDGDVRIAGTPSGASITYDQRGTPTIFMRGGFPERSDDLTLCVTSTKYVTIVWKGGDNLVCADTIEVDCNEVTECVSLLNQELECDRNAAGAVAFKWFFTMKNHSDHYGRNYTISSATQGVSITPSTVQSNSVVAPGSTFPRSNHTITGAQPGQTVVFLIEMCGSSGRDTRDVVCCTTRVVVKMPECEREDACIDILEQSITCDEESNAGSAGSYTWCFTFRNTSGFVINTVSVGNSSVNVGPVAPGSTARACLKIFGQPGPTTVGLVVCRVERVVDTIENRLVEREIKRECCDMTVRLELPKCREDGCFEIVEQEIECDSNGTYTWCFNVRNQANWNMGSFSFDGLPGGVISPRQVVFRQPIPPGGLSERICVQISGMRPGRYPLLGLNHANILDVICSDSLVIELPECEHREKDCCENFVINLQGAQPVAGTNGFTGILGQIQAGPLPITKASATIVSASINGQPAFGYALNGVILNPLGNGTVMPGQFGQEIRWSNPNGVPMMNPSFSLNWLRFPPMAPNARVDTLRFCIRWQFTDTECRTCEKLVCYEVVRRRFIFTGRGVTGIESKGASASSVGEDYIGGALTGDNSGTLQVYLPNPPAELGTVKYTGLTVQASDGATITGAVEASGSPGFTVRNGLAQSDFDMEAGEELTVKLDYTGLDGRPSLGHFVLISYTSSNMPGVVQQIPATVTLRRDGLGGGDEVDAVSAEVPGSTVQTFAIHVRNNNGSKEKLSGIRLKALSTMEFLAVGPTSSKTEATLRFGYSSEEGQAYISEAAEGTVSLDPGAERKPIYVTLAVGPESAPFIGYETLNEFGETISEGEIDLRQISSTRDAGDLTGSALSQLGDVMPNPASGSASILFTLTNTTDVNLTLRDARGTEVAQMVDGERLDKGNHVVTFDVSELPNGTYFYTLETAGGTETGKMVIRR